MINNYNSKQSSCYFLDIRNSTKIIRTISLNKRNRSISVTKKIDSQKLVFHSKFMLDIHRFLFEKLKKLNITDYYFNNTGDGHVCLLWNKTHAWTVLDIACSISVYLEKRIEEYNIKYLKPWEEEYHKDLSTGFGIGMHTGGSIVTEESKANQRFAYGIVLNSAARIESFTKNFTRTPLLFTRNFKNRLERQFNHLESPKMNTWSQYEKIISPVTMFPVETKDSKTSGHLLYTLTKRNRLNFITG